MGYYATLLNFHNAGNQALDLKDLFDHSLQASVFHRMLWGAGFTEEESMKDAMDNLADQNIIETFKCGSGVYEIINHYSGKDAIRHLWLHDDGSEDSPILCALPYHEMLIDFCIRYRLSEKAKDELASFFESVTHANR